MGPMQVARRILVAVDFSGTSDASVRYAARLAAGLGAELLLVNVIHRRDVEGMKRVAEKAPEWTVERQLEEEVADRRRRFKDLVVLAAAAGAHATTHIRIGQPYEELLEEIAEKEADLLVMGVKGRSNFMDTVVGSCAHRMFRRCPVPLLSVR
jgi:nucleotide-binding universal stress UspA family protein